MNRETIAKEIIRVAGHFVNLYEIKSNAEWRFITDPKQGKPESDELLAVMKSCGWQAGWPYCAALCESVWKLAYKNLDAPEDLIKDITSKLNPSVMSSFNNFKESISKEPVPGSIFFMQKGKSANGHAGIVVACDGKTIATIEGNTSAGKAISDEADRNGDGIFKKTRTFSLVPTSGLHLVGFLPPIEW